MTHDDLVTWANNTAVLLTTQLPLQSLQSATNLAFAYISNVGGWMPDDQQNPDGPGLPFNGASEAQGAADITTQQIGNVYDLNFSVTITVNCQFSQQLGSGLNLDAAATAMANDVTNLITSVINGSVLPVRVDSMVAPTTGNSNRSLLGGNTTQSVRANIAIDAFGVDKIVDYKAAALLHAMTTYGLDNTWNVKYVYIQENSPIVVLIVKYTNNTFATLDNNSHTIYVFTVSPTTHEIVSGSILTSD